MSQTDLLSLEPACLLLGALSLISLVVSQIKHLKDQVLELRCEPAEEQRVSGVRLLRLGRVGLS